MICSILLLISLTSCVSGSFVVNVTQTSYQAEEDQDITLEWTFTTRTNTSSKSVSIICELLTDPRPSVLFHLHEGVQVPESQDEQFVGRVRCDEDVLREGRLRLHVARLRISDSGLYRCNVSTSYGESSGSCHVNVTAAPEEEEPENRGMIAVYVVVALAAIALAIKLCYIYRQCFTKCKKKSNTGAVV